MMRLTTRERQLIEVEKENEVLKSSIVPTLGALRSTLLDPAVNLIIQKLKKDLAETKKKLEDTQNDLNATKFTTDRYIIPIYAKVSGLCVPTHSSNSFVSILIVDF